MAADGGDVSETKIAVVDYITIGNVSRWPSVLGVQEEKNGRRFSRPHTERVGSRESRVRFGGWGVGDAVTGIMGTPPIWGTQCHGKMGPRPPFSGRMAHSSGTEDRG